MYLNKTKDPYSWKYEEIRIKLSKKELDRMHPAERLKYLREVSKRSKRK